MTAKGNQGLNLRFLQMWPGVEQPLIFGRPQAWSPFPYEGQQGPEQTRLALNSVQSPTLYILGLCPRAHQ